MLETALADLVAAGQVPAGVNVQPISAGESNDNFLLSCAEGRWVLRLNNPAFAGHVDRVQEQDNWRLAAASGLAPDLLYADPLQRFFLSEYVPQTAPLDLDNPRQRQALLDLLAGLCRLSLPANRVDYAGRASQYLQNADDPLIARVASLQAHLVQAVPLCCYCHHDLNPDNLRFDGRRLHCIDFEYAGQGHPLFELAVITRTHGQGAAWRQTLLDGHPLLHGLAPGLLLQAESLYDALEDCWYRGLHLLDKNRGHRRDTP